MAKTSSQNTNTAPLTEQLQNPPKIITGTGAGGAIDQASQSPNKGPWIRGYDFEVIG